MTINYLNETDGNLFIGKNLQDGNLLSICRLGIVELNSLYCYQNFKDIPHNWKYLLQHNAGVYGDSISDFISEYISAIKYCNTNIIWNDANIYHQQKFLHDSLYPKTSTLIAHRSVEPFYFDDPWSGYLRDKRVLVVSPFCESIQFQYLNHRTNLWTNSHILPNFTLISYQSIQSIGNNGPHKNWKESLEIMKAEISKLKFDVAILGCGAYGVPLVNHIANNMHRSAIYIGGGLQILFGIKGKRWDSHDVVSKFYNEYWIRPKSSETPTFAYNIENGCYW